MTVVSMPWTEPQAAPYGLGFANDGRPRVLCVDADTDLLESVDRIFGARYELRLVSAPYEAMAALEAEGPFAVMISDLAVPGLDGIELLDLCRQISPATQRIIMSGTQDVAIAVEAVNRSGVNGILTKPFEPQTLATRLDEASAAHRQLIHEQMASEQTLHGCAESMVELLALANPAAGQITRRVRRLVDLFLDRNPSGTDWELRLAASLCQLGAASLGPDLNERLLNGMDLSEAEILLGSCVPSFTQELLGRIPGIDQVMDIVRDHRTPHYETLRPGGGGSYAASVLNVCVHVAEMESMGHTPADIIQVLRSDHSEYDADIVAKFLEIYRPIGSPDLVLPTTWN